MKQFSKVHSYAAAQLHRMRVQSDAICGMKFIATFPTSWCVLAPSVLHCTLLNCKMSTRPTTDRPMTWHSFFSVLKRDVITTASRDACIFFIVPIFLRGGLANIRYSPLDAILLVMWWTQIGIWLECTLLSAASSGTVKLGYKRI